MNEATKGAIVLYVCLWSSGRKASELRMRAYRSLSKQYMKAAFLATKAMNNELDRWSQK